MPFDDGFIDLLDQVQHVLTGYQLEVAPVMHGKESCATFQLEDDPSLKFFGNAGRREFDEFLGMFEFMEQLAAREHVFRYLAVMSAIVRHRLTRFELEIACF